MPQYIDHHPKMDMSKMPADAQRKGQQMLSRLRQEVISKKSDKFGVKTENVFLGSSGEAWCITDAPNIDAVLKSHEANGLMLTSADVSPVTPLV